MFKVLIVDDEEWNRDIIKTWAGGMNWAWWSRGRPRTDWRRCG